MCDYVRRGSGCEPTYGKLGERGSDIGKNWSDVNVGGTYGWMDKNG